MNDLDFFRGRLSSRERLRHIRHWISRRRKQLEIEPWGIKWSHDRRRQVTPKGQVVTPIRLESNVEKTAGNAI